MRAQILKVISNSGIKAAFCRPTGPPGETGRDGSTGLRRTLAVAVAGVTLSVSMALVVAHWENKVADLAFNGRANNVATTLQTGLNEYLSKIVALRALFEASDQGVTRAEFQVFADRLLEKQPAILGVSWIPRVSRDERTAHEQAVVKDGIANYRIRSIGSDGKIAAAPEKDEYFPVLYASERGNPDAIYGFDLGDSGMRENAIERARDSNELAASKSLALQTATGDRRGFFVVLPIYRPHAPHGTVEERRANVIGFVQGVFKIDVMVDTILSGIKAPIDFAIYPSSIELTTEPLLVRFARLPDAPDLAAFAMAERRWSGEVKVADLWWKLAAMPSHPHAAFPFMSSLVLLGAGLLLTAVGSAFVWSSARQSMRLLFAHKKVSELAHSDVLTAIPNRRAFVERLKAACQAGQPVSVLYIDLDHFKDINDTLGHSTGDRLLQLASERLKRAIRQQDMVARFGGDEFAVLRVGATDATSLSGFAVRLGETLAEPYHIDGNDITTTATIGVTSSSKKASEPEALMMQADIALYRAKEDGRNCFRLYDQVLDEKFRERVTISDGIRRGIDRGELRLHYQPQVEIASGRLIGLEAVVRWYHPARGVVPPAVFIPIAERTGAIIPLGKWVFEEACRQFAQWRAEGIAPPTLAVNLSAIQCRHAGLENDFRDVMARHAIPPGCLEVELTESVLMDTAVQQRDVIERLKGIGLKIAIDDFGTGYSSLNYLAEYPVDRLKIAQELVFGVTENLRHELVVKAAIRLAHELGTEVIAEGVETDGQARFLMAAECEYAQGYLFSPPLSANAATELLRRGRTNAVPGRFLPDVAANAAPRRKRQVNR
jgi:diguanylate cyclase (GGDEF)-like protein